MPTVRIGKKEYDVNKDFSWRELLTIEELGGAPLGDERSFERMAVMSAFVFVILKRDDPALTWEKFLDGNIGDLMADDEDEPDEPDGAAKPAAKRRPTKPSA